MKNKVVFNECGVYWNADTKCIGSYEYDDNGYSGLSLNYDDLTDDQVQEIENAFGLMQYEFNTKDN